jgi:hypothetical protein
VSTPEGAILKAICQYLSLLENQGKLVYWRQNNGATYDPKRKAFRSTSGTGYKYGVPDIAVIARTGVFIGLEVKAPKGVQSDNQKALQKLLEGVGARYAVVRSVDDVVAVLSVWAP